MSPMMMKKYANIDEYIENFPKEVQTLLQDIRQTIQKTAPEAVEAISYGIPTFKLHGNLVHFAGYKNHLAFYPGALALEVFQKEVEKYQQGKGTIQFPVEGPVPLELIAKITAFRVKENLKKAK